MKFGQVIATEITATVIFFFKNHAEIEAGRLVPDNLFLFFKKALHEVNANGLYLSFSHL